MKLLFLDIDGCLNSYRSDLIFGHEKKIENLDPIALALVQKVVKETGCVICLSSDWRFYHDYTKLGKQLNLPILFETAHPKKEEDEDRAAEIQEVIDGLKPEKYAIIDDEEYRHEFDGMVWVNVAEEEGFSYKDYLLTVSYLK